MRVWDRRMLPATGATALQCVKELKHHAAAIMRVEWHPHVPVSATPLQSACWPQPPHNPCTTSHEQLLIA